MGELKPCPFCNASGDRVGVLTSGREFDLFASSVECLACDAVGPRATGYDEKKVRTKAITEWNKVAREGPKNG